MLNEVFLHFEPILTLIGPVVQIPVAPLLGFFCSWVLILFPGALRSSQPSLVRVPNRSIVLSLMLVLKLFGSLNSSMSLVNRFPFLFFSIFCDNISATYMADNPVFHARTRHIELDYRYVRERVALGSHRVLFVPSIDQLADLLNKRLFKRRHLQLCSKLVCPRPSSLEC